MPDQSAEALRRVRDFPRLRYMGSKYKLAPHLAEVFGNVGGRSAVDAFCGSGVVSYLLKAQGYRVTSNDFLNFPSVIARDRDFIQSTFDGLYYTPEAREWLDSAWSHIDLLTGYERDIAISALVLSAARKQPRGVFTFTDSTKYADGRCDLRLSCPEHFREAVAAYNAVVFDNGVSGHKAHHGDVFDLRPDNNADAPPDLVYLDPPYAPPTDDADYIKRYHLLEGLSAYWRGMEIMENTKTKKLTKRFTPFAYKRTIEDALSRSFEQFEDAGTIVLSYSSNALPPADRIVDLLGKVKPRVETIAIDHKYSFGTHAAATRQNVSEYLFVGTDE